MRVQWVSYISIPEEYWSEASNPVVDSDVYEPLSVKHSGEVIGVVNSFLGGTKLVVMTDEGRVVEVEASRVKKENE